MQVRKFVVLGLLAGFLAAPAARAFAGDESRDPAAASDSEAPVKHHAKKKKKATHKTKKHAAKKSAKHAKSHHKSSSNTGTGTHYPTQPGGSGFADIPNEKKDDLPPPASPPNND